MNRKNKRTISLVLAMTFGIAAAMSVVPPQPTPLKKKSKPRTHPVSPHKNK